MIKLKDQGNMQLGHVTSGENVDLPEGSASTKMSSPCLQFNGEKQRKYGLA